MIVRLSAGEVFQAAMAGVMRRCSALKRSRPEPYGSPGERGPWDVDVEGAAAELAVAKALGKYWESYAGAPAELAGDVGQLQVRSSSYPRGSLIVHDRDPDAAIFVLVLGRAPELRLAGWLRGAEAKDPIFWRADIPRPAYMVPQRALRPVSELLA